jgi:2,3-bisphosphoglycerate-independent phosphoglycerate mutase
MNIHDLVAELREDSGSKIVLLVADGLGGLPLQPGGKTELETARTPNLDACVREGVCGLSLPVLPGITPGSGPGHLALFGYDPLEYRIGRGILEALGINFKVGAKDVAVRGNFVSLENGIIKDRRAGRPSTDRCKAMVEKMRQVKIPGVEVFVEPVKEHRFVAVFRGAGVGDLGDHVNDTDPQAVGVAPLKAEGTDADSKKTATAADEFVAQVSRILKDEAPTNGCTLRGFARYPKIATMKEVYGLRSAAIAVYPMYKGLARLVGMDVLDAGDTIESQVATLRRVWNDHDFFFLHFKYTDSTGEDGAFDKKVQAIEKLDAAIPGILELKPDAATARTDGVTEFGEEACLRGGLGQFQAKHLMLLAMAHAGRFGKYGA